MIETFVEAGQLEFVGEQENVTLKTVLHLPVVETGVEQIENVEPLRDAVGVVKMIAGAATHCNN